MKFELDLNIVESRCLCSKAIRIIWNCSDLSGAHGCCIKLASRCTKAANWANMSAEISLNRQKKQ